nr:F-box only protein 36 isoform X1 [Peromyscus maniculatus bairdii]
MATGPPPAPQPPLTSAPRSPAGLLGGCCSPRPSFPASTAGPASPAGTSSSSVSLDFPGRRRLPTPARPASPAQPPPAAGRPLPRSKLTPAALLGPLPHNSCHSSCSLVSISGPSAAQSLPFPVSGPPVPFPGNPCRLHAPHLHFRPPTFSLPRRPPGSKDHFRSPPGPRWAPPDPHALPRFRLGPSSSQEA